MIITRQIAALQLLKHLQHKLSLAELIAWAEECVMEQEFEKGAESALRDVLGKLGLADVRAFGLTWEDCESMMHNLGYNMKVEATLAA